MPEGRRSAWGKALALLLACLWLGALAQLMAPEGSDFSGLLPAGSANGRLPGSPLLVAETVQAPEFETEISPAAPAAARLLGWPAAGDSSLEGGAKHRADRSRSYKLFQVYLI